MNSVLKWIGILDGAAMAAATAFGQAYPPWQPACAIVVEVGGALATALATIGHVVPAKQ